MGAEFRESFDLGCEMGTVQHPYVILRKSRRDAQ